MSNYPSQEHPSHDDSSWSGRGRDEQFGRTYNDPYRDQEFGGNQRRLGQQEQQAGRGYQQGGYGAQSGYGESPYQSSSNSDRDFYEQNPAHQNYGQSNFNQGTYGHNNYGQGNFGQRGGQAFGGQNYRGGRFQHRNEPWPRNEDRDNYSSSMNYGRDYMDDNHPASGRYHGSDRGGRHGGYRDYGQSYGGPAPDYQQFQDSSRWREGSQRGQGNFYQQGDYDGGRFAGSPAHRPLPQPGFFQTGDFSQQQGYTRSEYPEDTSYLYASHPYSQSLQQGGRALATQSWQEREGAQRGAFGLQSSHRGRGPEGYTRSDDRIREDICERLSEHHYIDASQIRVEVNQGVVTLEGAVDDRWQKYQTEDLVDATSGVKDIQNRLTVSRASRQSAQWTSQHGAQQMAGGEEKLGQSNATQGNATQSAASQVGGTQQPSAAQVAADGNGKRTGSSEKSGDSGRNKPGLGTN